MRITFRRVAMWMILPLLARPTFLLAQQATTSRRVILQRDPTTSSPALEHLAKGVKVTLLDASPCDGFLHGRTEDDQIGRVQSKYIAVSTTNLGTQRQGENLDGTLRDPVDNSEQDKQKTTDCAEAYLKSAANTEVPPSTREKSRSRRTVRPDFAAAELPT